MCEASTADQAEEQDDQCVTEEAGQAIIEPLKKSFNETENATVDESVEVEETFVWNQLRKLTNLREIKLFRK